MLVLSCSFIGLFVGFVTCIGLKFRSSVLNISKIAMSRSSEELIRDIGYFFSLEQWGKAELALRKLSKERRYHRQTLLFFSYLYRKTNRLITALKVVEQGIKLFPDEKRFSLERGLVCVELGKAEEAVASFDDAICVIREENHKLAFARALFCAGQFKRSWAILEPLSQILSTGEIWELMGQVLFELHKWEEAFLAYKKTLQSGRDSAQILEKLGHIARKLGNLDQAAKFFQMLLKKEAIDCVAAGLFGLGLCAEDRGHYHKAFLIYQASLSKGALSPLVLKHAGLCALREGAFLLAEEYLSSLLSLRHQGTKDPSLMLYYGLACEYQKKWQKAETIYLKLIVEHKNYIFGYRALSRLFAQGLSRFLSPEEGLKIAYTMLQGTSDDEALKIFEACQQRVLLQNENHQVMGQQPPVSWAKTKRRPMLRHAHAHQTLAA